MYASVQPKKDAHGYYRNIGYVIQGSRSQPKIRLGKDKIAATERLARIIQLWQWHNEKSATWGAVLEVAKAIGRGDRTYTVRSEGDEAADYGAAVVAEYLLENPVIDIAVEGNVKTLLEHEAKDVHKRAERWFAHAEQYQAATGGKPLTGSLHDVLQTYSDQLATVYHDAENDCISDHGRTVQRRCKTLRRLLPDKALTTLDYEAIDELYGILRNRPKKQDGTPYERQSCQHLIKALNTALNFADTSSRWQWELPRKFSKIKKSVARLERDNHRAIETPVYTAHEIKMLWQVARPNERLLVALALNCGMGADQIGRLRISRVKLRDDKPSYIKARRFKRDVIGRWRLWNVTVELIKWALITRPESAEHDILVVNRKGKSLYGKSSGGDRSRQIANTWYRLLDRVQKKAPSFRRLGFNSLRDTSAQMVRNVAGGEIASIHLAHKHTTSDTLLGCYTSPNYKVLSKTLRRIERKLAPVWAAVDEPTQEPPRPNSKVFGQMQL